MEADERPSWPSLSVTLEKGTEKTAETSNSFIGKSNICVVCASKILDDYDNDEIRVTPHHQLPPHKSVVSSHNFLQGVSVFCQALNIEPNYGQTESWAGVTTFTGGSGNLANYVCCRVCYGLFENLVKLHELIVSTQKALKQEVDIIQEKVLQSHITAGAEEVEYSINACVYFRHDILKKIGNTHYDTKSSDKSQHFDKPIYIGKSELGRHRCKSTVKKSHGRNSSQGNLSVNPVVLLEKLDLFEFKKDVNNCEQILPENDYYSDTESDFALETTFSNYETTTKPLSFSNSFGSNNDETGENNIPNNNKDTNTQIPKKRGRPRIHPVVEKIPGRKRGRPCKLPVPVSVVTGTQTVTGYRTRGRPSRLFSRDDAEDGSDTDKDYTPNGSDVDFMANGSRRATKRARRTNNRSHSEVKRKIGRPLLHDRSIMPEGPKRTPIFVLHGPRGQYMFLNVKFEKILDGLYCRHPNCSFEVLVQGYFTEQTAAFKNMRLHIRNFHRYRYNTRELGKDRQKYHFCCHCKIQLTSGRDLLAHKKKFHPGKQIPLTLCEVCGDTMHLKEIFRHRLTHIDASLANVSKRLGGRPRKYVWAEDADAHLVDDDDVVPNNSKERKALAAAYSRRRRRLIALGRSDLKRPIGRPLLRDKSALPDGPKLTPIYALQVSRGLFMFVNVKFEKDRDKIFCRHPDCSFSTPAGGYFTDQTAAFQRMRLHIRNFHRNKYKTQENDSQKYHYCCYCEVQLNCGRVLRAHKKDIHTGEMTPLAFCEICGDIMDPQLIFRHRRSHKNEAEKEECVRKRAEGPPLARKKVNPTTTPRNYPCDKCLKVFNTRRQQKSHEQTHIPVKLRRQVVCDICGKVVITEQNLKMHKQTVHFRAELPAAFECHICNKKFLSSEGSRYQSHLNVHLGLRPFQCSLCGKGFNARYSLTLHERTHLDDPLTKCPFCPNTYKKDRYLKRHLAARHPESMNSTRKRNGEHSQEIFIGPKLMYPCEPCGKVFQYKSRLVKHLKGKHNWSLEKNEEYPNQLTWQDHFNDDN